MGDGGAKMRWLLTRERLVPVSLPVDGYTCIVRQSGVHVLLHARFVRVDETH